MLDLHGFLISEDIIEKQFVCHLEHCRGACCKAGDTGAPLEQEEIPVIEKLLDKVLPYLPKKSQNKISREGFWKRDDDYELVTNFHLSGDCVFVFYDENKILKCGFEQAYNDKKINWKKPVSCHLYPIRVERLRNHTALNYHKWDICKQACKLGKELKVPIYRFVKDGLVRKFGSAFYDELDQVAHAWLQERGQ